MPNPEDDLLEAGRSDVCATLGVPLVVNASGRRQKAVCRRDQLAVASQRELQQLVQHAPLAESKAK
jgi:hypothetical protein